jgi:hypothetical protein
MHYIRRHLGRCGEMADALDLKSKDPLQVVWVRLPPATLAVAHWRATARSSEIDRDLRRVRTYSFMQVERLTD